LSKDIRTGGRCTLEYDSKDFNLGFHLPINESFALNLALTQLPFRTGINSAYGVNVPYENLSIGVDYTFNLFAFYGAEYRRLATQYRDLEDKSVYVNDKLKVIVNNVDQSEQAMVDLREQKSFMMSELKKDIDEARKQKEQLKGDVKALRDIIASEGFKSVNTLKEDILKYYYRALQYYYDEKYFEAIGELSKANLINDQIPEIHIRMGSIYWTMGLRNEALAAWRKAYGLDKNNEVLNTFLLEHHVDIKQWGPK
jgi:tetratricopeptide (TPR) repeat protein